MMENVPGQHLQQMLVYCTLQGPGRTLGVRLLDRPCAQADRRSKAVGCVGWAAIAIKIGPQATLQWSAPATVS